MAAGLSWPRGSLLGAHLALNLGGWLGTAIVGTLHTFFPSLTQTRLRRPRLQAPTFRLWLLGIGALAAGAAAGADVCVAGGWACLLAATALLEVNLVGSLRAAPVGLGLPARLIALGHAFLPAGVALALIATVADGAAAPFTGAARGPVAALLLAGWIGLTVAGALLHLLAVLARVRHFTRAMPTARPARDRAVTAAGALAVAGLALSGADGLGGLHAPASALLVACAALIAARVLRLARDALSGRGPSPVARRATG